MLTLYLLSRTYPCSQSLPSLESLLEALGSSVLQSALLPLLLLSVILLQVKQLKQHWPQRQALTGPGLKSKSHREFPREPLKDGRGAKSPCLSCPKGFCLQTCFRKLSASSWDPNLPFNVMSRPRVRNFCRSSHR